MRRGGEEDEGKLRGRGYPAAAHLADRFVVPPTAQFEAMPAITGGPGVPKAAPFLSPAVLDPNSNTLYLSGQCGVDLEGNFIGGTVADRTKQTMRNIAAVLRAAGMGLEDSSSPSRSPIALSVPSLRPTRNI